MKCAANSSCIFPVHSFSLCLPHLRLEYLLDNWNQDYDFPSLEARFYKWPTLAIFLNSFSQNFPVSDTWFRVFIPLLNDKSKWYLADNPEYKRRLNIENCRAYYRKHRVQGITRSRQYYYSHREEILCRFRKEYSDGKNGRVRSYERVA